MDNKFESGSQGDKLMKPVVILIDDNKEICKFFNSLKPQYCDPIAVSNFNELLNVLDETWKKCQYISLILVDENYEELKPECLITKHSRQEGQFLLDFVIAVTLFQIPRPLCFPLHRGRKIITNLKTFDKPIWIKLKDFFKLFQKNDKYKNLYESAYKKWENSPITDLSNSKANSDFKSFADEITSIWQEIKKEFFNTPQNKIIEILPTSSISLFDTKNNTNIELKDEFSSLLLLFIFEEFKKNIELFPLFPDINEERKNFIAISESLIDVISKFPLFPINTKDSLYWKLRNSINKIPENIYNKKWERIINVSQKDWKTDNPYISLKCKGYIPRIDSQNCWNKWREKDEWKEIIKIFLIYWQKKIFNKYQLTRSPWLPSFLSMKNIRK